MDSDKFVTRFQEDVLVKLENETNKDIVIIGDFNADVGALKLHNHTRKLMQITRLHGFTQLIKNPTRVTEDTSSTIDLIFVNNFHRIVTHGVQECGISDHSIVFATKKSGFPKGPAQVHEIRSYKNFNKESFRQDIAWVPWSIIESFDDINDAVEAWNNLFSDVANWHAPLPNINLHNKALDHN